MKKSLIVRWIIIAAVLLVWGLAMLPLKDRNLIKVFEDKAAKTVSKLEAEAAAFKGDPDALRETIAKADKSSEEYKKAVEELEKMLSDEAYIAWRKVRDYKELQRRLALIDRKSDFEKAAAIKAEMDALPANAEADKKVYQQQYDAIVGAAEYKAWLETLEYKELVKRLPLQKKIAEQRNLADKSGEAYLKLADEIKALQAAVSVRPEFKDKSEEKAYDDVVRHLSLAYDIEKNVSSFKKLEKAANGNSELYRISLNDFIKVPFHPHTSNKTVMNYLRVKSAGKLRLGLDLRGGTEFVLDFDIDEAKGLLVTEKTMQGFLAAYFNNDAKVTAAVPEELGKKLKAFAEGKGEAEDVAMAAVKDAALAAEVRTFLAANIDLIKNEEAVNYGGVTEIRDRILNILDNRLNSTGVTEPEIKATGDNTISVRMPSVDEADKNEIRNLIRRAARLEFYLVAQDSNRLAEEYAKDPQSFKTPAGLIRSEIEHEKNDGSVTYTTIFLEEKPTAAKGEDIERAFPTTDEFGRWCISLKFNGRGSAAFRDVTSKNVGRLLAIVLDGTVYSAPVLKTAIDNGQAQITGSFTLEEAKRLASVIASGNVPVTVNIGSEFGTDPTLGSDSISSGYRAALIGLALVVVFMLLYYRLAGLVAIIALVVNTFLVVGTMAIMHATITMPGIAGMILTIGMAVDANVIIFERIREELATKTSLAGAVMVGYGKAFSSIFDSNLTTLITCFFLYNFGTGAVKGFAVTLAFGIFASMFTAIFMTRALFDLMTFTDAVKSLPMYIFGFFKDMKFDYVGKRKIVYTLSLVLLVISLGAFLVRGKGMLGIDFAGGTELSYECSGETPNVDKIRAFLVEEGYSDNVRVGYKKGQSGQPLLEIVLPTSGKDVEYTAFNDRLDKKFPEVRISIKQTNTVGANVGSQFRVAAFWAAFFSILGVIIYLAFRFDRKYGFAAAVAVAHDAIISLGFFLVCGGSLSLTVIAAVMTIIGYSLNDTIVIFDRVRETQELNKGVKYGELVNKAVNDCMSRTIITSLTTMFVVVCLLVLGGGAVRDFALVMFFGVIIGTYSSVFIATNLVNTWHKGHGTKSLASAK